MEFIKKIFETLDKIFYKSFNEKVEIEGVEDISIFENVKYFEDVQDCNMDLFYDEKVKSKRPVIIYIHGGGFVAGGKEFRKGISLWYATKGFFVANADYGLSPEYKFPAQIEHLSKLFVWLKKNQKEYNLDLKKIIVSGDSAGAYFAAMLACISESKALQRKLGISIDLHLAGVVLNCGLYDLKSILEKKLAFGLNDAIFESYTGTKKKDVEDYGFKKLCSPLELINKRFPQTFLIYAEKDVFCAGQAERLSEKLEEKDIYFEKFYSTSPFVNHCFSLDLKNKTAARAMRLQEEFLIKIKRGKLPKKLSKARLIVNESK